MQLGFGSGILWGTQTQDAYGNAIAASAQSSLLLGVLQDVSVDINADVKELFGQNSFPFAVGRGKTKVGIKAKAAQVYGNLWNNLFFGQNNNLTQGTLYQDVYATTQMTVPATSAYVITISSAASSATNIQIPNSGATGSATLLSIVNANGVPMTQGAATALGVFTWTSASGAITFSSSDASLGVYISYGYHASVTGVSGTPGPYNQLVANIPMGYAPVFQTDLLMTYQGKSLTLTFFSCITSKLSFATKIDDFLIPEFDISAFANPAGQVMRWSTSE